MRYPSIVVLFTSYRCNACCIMCTAWQKQETARDLTPQDIRHIFSDKILMRSVRIINITGGEPTLRSDLVEIVRILSNSCIRIKRIDISTNGINTAEVIDKIGQVLACLLETDIKLSVSVSVDGVDKVHGKVRGVEGAFEKIDKTIDELKELMLLYPSFSLGLNATINRLNYFDLGNILDYSKKKELGLNFTLAALSQIGVESSSLKEAFILTDETRGPVSTFIENLLKTEQINIRYGNFLLYWLKTGIRKSRCAFREGKAILCDSDGSIYQCGNFRDFKIGNILEKPFKDIMSGDGHFVRQYKIRCNTCNSNCYIEGV